MKTDENHPTQKAAESNRRLTLSHGGVERIRTSAAVAHTNDLANRPLQPLEYHSVCDCSRKLRNHCPQAGDIRYDTRHDPSCQQDFILDSMKSCQDDGNGAGRSTDPSACGARFRKEAEPCLRDFRSRMQSSFTLTHCVPRQILRLPFPHALSSFLP